MKRRSLPGHCRPVPVHGIAQRKREGRVAGDEKAGTARTGSIEHLLTPDSAGNMVRIDPHKRTLPATVVDCRGGIVASEHFRVSGDGYRALEAWGRQFNSIVRWGIEGAAAWGRHTAIFLVGRGYDVRDVCPNRTSRHDRARQRGK